MFKLNKLNKLNKLLNNVKYSICCYYVSVLIHL